MSDEYGSGSEAPTPTRTKVIAGIVGSIVVLAGAYALLRVSSPAIRPDQPAPAGHYTLTCGLCHGLSESARPIEVPR